MKQALSHHNFATYFNQYIDLVEEEDAITALKNNSNEVKELFDFLTENHGDFCYAEGKWSIKELLCHIIDTERIFCYRALTFARNDKTELPGYDHDKYVLNSNANNRTLADISAEFEAVRKGTILLFNSFNAEMLERTGNASGNQLSVLSIGYIIAGHTTHHLNVLESKYLNQL